MTWQALMIQREMGEKSKGGIWREKDARCEGKQEAKIKRKERGGWRERAEVREEKMN